MTEKDLGAGLRPTPRPPTATPDSICGQCGAKPVAFAVYRTGGIFTPPPLGIWMFLCAACEAKKGGGWSNDEPRAAPSDSLESAPSGDAKGTRDG